MVLGALLALSPINARADAGLPMLAVVWPASWLLLPPIVGIEAWVAKKFCRFSWKAAVKGSLLANLASTFLGLPVAWGILLGIEIVLTRGGRAYGLDTALRRVASVTVQAPWLIPYEADLAWMVPSAASALMVPFFLMSVFFERWVFRKSVACEPLIARRWAWIGNGLTYGLLFILTAVVAGIRLWDRNWK